MNRWTPIAKSTLIAVAATLVIAYLADYAWVRIRMRKPTANDPFQAMTIRRIMEIPHKDGRDEIILEDPQTQTCVHSLFPQQGYSPCWYVARQNGKAVQMVIVPFFRLLEDGACAYSYRSATSGSTRMARRAGK